MGHALGPVLPLAAAEAMGPVSIACAVVMLMGDGGRRKGLAYLAGWVVGIVAVGAVVLAVAGSIGPGGRGSPSPWVSWLKLLAGGVLVVVAVIVGRHHRREAAPAAGAEPPTPAWLRAAERAGTGKAALLGAVSGSLNPVNAVLVGSAALTIAHEGVAADERVAALAVYTIVASLGVSAPVVAYLVRGERARPTLDALRRWLVVHQRAIVVVLCGAFAAKLVGDALPHLTR